MQHVPYTIFKSRVRNDTIDGNNPFEWKDINSTELFKDKSVVLFSLPGAFTPTCSSSHLPRYEELYTQFTDLGIDAVICLSVNDAFVMHQWGLSQNTKNVILLPDGNANFTRKMGMLVEKSDLGFGMRSWRYSMLIENGLIIKKFIENGFEDNCPTDPFEVSDADTMLDYLKAQAKNQAI
jgi:peroxiredoxin